MKLFCVTSEIWDNGQKLVEIGYTTAEEYPDLSNLGFTRPECGGEQKISVQEIDFPRLQLFQIAGDALWQKVACNRMPTMSEIRERIYVPQATEESELRITKMDDVLIWMLPEKKS